MLQFILSHWYVFAGAALVGLISVLSRFMKQNKQKQKQKEMTDLQKRNEALNETLRNPKVKKKSTVSAGPMEVQWDDKALNNSASGRKSMMIELVEFSTYSRRKYMFPADQAITIGSSADNQLVLPRDGVAPKHCEIYLTNKVFAVRSLSDSQATLVRGKASAYITREGVFLNNGDHIKMGAADIQFNCFKV